jgi:hypothetical protein
VAEVNGEKIAVRDFEQQKDKNLENRKAQSNNGNLSSAETYNIYNNTLEDMIKNLIMTEEYEAAGIGITSEELYDQMTGEHPHQWMVQSFSNEDGSQQGRCDELSSKPRPTSTAILRPLA